MPVFRFVMILASVVVTACAAPDATLRDAQSGGSTTSMLGANPPAGADFLPLRVGIEYLPPVATPSETVGAESLLSRSRGFSPSRRDPNAKVAALAAVGAMAGPITAPPSARHATPIDARTDGPIVVPLRLPSPPTTSADALGDASPTNDRWIWQLDAEELAAIEDPAERLTMMFVNDFIGEDRRRMQRELQTPILTNRLRYTMNPALRLPLDEREAEEEASFLNETAPGLLRRPLRNLLKKLTFVDDFEIALQEFKADHLPLSEAYQEREGRRGSLGRISMRLRLSDGSDPVELSYYNWGWRVGSSRERCRLQYRYRISDYFDASVGCRFDYLSHDSSVRADLRYIVDERTHVTMLLGDRLDFLSGPTAYSFLNSPLDGTPGVLFYVEHLF